MPTCKPPPSCAADVPEAAGSLAASSSCRPYPLFRSLPPAVNSPMNTLRTGQSGGMNIPLCRAPANGCERFPDRVCTGGGGKPRNLFLLPSSPSFSVSSARGEFAMNPLRTGQAVACMFRSAAQRQTVAKGSPNCICAGGRREASQPLPLAVLTLFSVSSARGGFADEPAPNRASGGMHVPLCRAAANGCEKFPGLRMRRRAAGSHGCVCAEGAGSRSLRGKERVGHEKSDNSAIRREAVLRNCPSPGLKKMPCFP